MKPMPPLNALKTRRGYDKPWASSSKPRASVEPVACRLPSKAFLVACSILKAPTIDSPAGASLIQLPNITAPLAGDSGVASPRVPPPSNDESSTLLARLQLAKQRCIIPPSDTLPMDEVGLKPSSYHEAPLRHTPVNIAKTASPRVVGSVVVSPDRPTSSFTQRILQINQSLKALNDSRFAQNASSTGSTMFEPTSSSVGGVDVVASPLLRQAHAFALLPSTQPIVKPPHSPSTFLTHLPPHNTIPDRNARGTPVTVSSRTPPARNSTSTTIPTPPLASASSPKSPSRVANATRARRPSRRRSRPRSRNTSRPLSPRVQPHTGPRTHHPMPHPPPTLPLPSHSPHSPRSPHSDPRTHRSAQAVQRPNDPAQHAGRHQEHHRPLAPLPPQPLSHTQAQGRLRQPPQRQRPQRPQERLHQPRSQAPQHQSVSAQRPSLRMSRAYSSSLSAPSTHHEGSSLAPSPLPAAVADALASLAPSPSTPSSTSPRTHPLPLPPPSMSPSMPNNPPLPVAMAHPPTSSPSRPHPPPLSLAALAHLAAILSPAAAARATPASLRGSPAPVSSAHTHMYDLGAPAPASADVHESHTLPCHSYPAPHAHPPHTMRTTRVSRATHSFPLCGASPTAPPAMGSPRAGESVPPHFAVCAQQPQEHPLHSHAYATHTGALGLHSQACLPHPSPCVSCACPAVCSAQPCGSGTQHGHIAAPHTSLSEHTRPASSASMATQTTLASHLAPPSPVVREVASAAVVQAPSSDAGEGECSCVSDDVACAGVQCGCECDTEGLRRANEEYERENEELRCRLARAESEVRGYVSVLEAARAGLAEAEKEYSALHDHYTTTQTHHAADRYRYAATEARYTAERELRETLEREVCELKGMLHSLRETHERRLAGDMASLRGLTEEVGSLTDANRRLQVQWEALMAENTRLAEENQAFALMVEQLQDERSALLATNADLEARNALLAREEGEVSELRRRNEEAEVRNVDLKREMMAVVLAHQETKTELAATLERNAAAETLIEQLRRQVIQLRADHEAEVAKLKASAGEAVRDGKRERVRVQALQARCDQLSANERTLQARITGKTAEVAQLSELLRRQKEELRLLRSMEAHMRAEKDVALQEARFLQEQVKNNNKHGEEVRHAISYEVARVSALHEEMVRTDTVMTHRLAATAEREAVLQKQVDVLLAREVSLCEAIRELVQQARTREQEWRERERALSPLGEQSQAQHGCV